MFKYLFTVHKYIRGVLENLRVQASDAVDGMAAHNAQVRHVHLGLGLGLGSVDGMAAHNAQVRHVHIGSGLGLELGIVGFSPTSRQTRQSATCGCAAQCRLHGHGVGVYGMSVHGVGIYGMSGHGVGVYVVGVYGMSGHGWVCSG